MGSKNCPTATSLWILYAELEEEHSSLAIARSVLEKARQKNPANADLWLEAIRMETRNSMEKEAMTLMARALQDCPSSGKLWALSIDMEQPRHKKGKSVDALKKCDNDAYVMLAVAKLFASERYNRQHENHPPFSLINQMVLTFTFEFGGKSRRRDLGSIGLLRLRLISETPGLIIMTLR